MSEDQGEEEGILKLSEREDAIRVALVTYSAGAYSTSQALAAIAALWPQEFGAEAMALNAGLQGLVQRLKQMPEVSEIQSKLSALKELQLAGADSEDQEEEPNDGD